MWFEVTVYAVRSTLKREWSKRRVPTGAWGIMLVGAHWCKTQSMGILTLAQAEFCTYNRLLIDVEIRLGGLVLFHGEEDDARGFFQGEEDDAWATFQAEEDVAWA
ncbi:hypothetical protein Tco_0626410 [Tanacetum coccineum]|uniref:Uncharacterized protein n=1 Tax=Tanacetum coccineum TaxID=301880 RepID=A0ABQ4WJR7_9ASTR